jgi:hypothetical protein
MTTINLSELDFGNIRASLVNYLKKQDTVKDLNFEGSAVNFLLDLLAYNTLYYAHFANMISGEAFLDTAQLERSVVSLVKPLGYVLPTKTSSVGRIKLTNVTTSTVLKPFTVNVVGSTPEGIRYQFWNVDELLVGPNNETEYFSIYEGTYVSLGFGGDGFDFPEQRILIPDLNMDIKTLKVSVKRAQDEEYLYWNLIDTYSGGYVDQTSNLYSLERTTSGFVVKFQVTANANYNLVAGDLVKVEYLSSNGSNSNNSSNYTAGLIPSGSSIVFLQPSFGGLDSPNLSSAKTVAPLVFSAQQRLVTKLDYIGFLAQLGYSNGVNVWGGEENTPPMYGRLLFSINGIQTADNSLVKQLLSKIKERSIVTILPEYIPPVSLVVNLTLQTTYNSETVTIMPEEAIDLIVNDINSEYKIGSFNNNLTEDKIRNTVQKYPGYFLTRISDVELEYTVVPSTRSVTLNYKNQINRVESTTAGNGITSTLFESPYFPTSKVQIYDVPILYPANSINPPVIGKLKLFSRDENTNNVDDLNVVVGEIDYKTGIVSLYPGISTQSFKLYAKPKAATTVLAKDEVYLTLNINAEQPQEI